MLLHEATVQDAHVARCGETFNLVQKARLAAARLASHHHELALAANRHVEPLLKPGQLLLASDEG